MTTVCIAIFATPFIYYSIKLKKEKAKHQSEIKKFFERFDFNPTQSHSWRNLYNIAIDTDNGLVLYMKFSENPVQEMIKLTEVSKVTPLEKLRSIELVNGKRNVLSYLAIQLQLKDSPNEIKTLEFYDEDLFSDLVGEQVNMGNGLY